jgi:hypothetical protein
LHGVYDSLEYNKQASRTTEVNIRKMRTVYIHLSTEKEGRW